MCVWGGIKNGSHQALLEVLGRKGVLPLRHLVFLPTALIMHDMRRICQVGTKPFAIFPATGWLVKSGRLALAATAVVWLRTLFVPSYRSESRP